MAKPYHKLTTMTTTEKELLKTISRVTVFSFEDLKVSYERIGSFDQLLALTRFACHLNVTSLDEAADRFRTLELPLVWPVTT